jgi:hypothetical protein
VHVRTLLDSVVVGTTAVIPPSVPGLLGILLSMGPGPYYSIIHTSIPSTSCNPYNKYSTTLHSLLMGWHFLCKDPPSPPPPPPVIAHILRQLNFILLSSPSIYLHQHQFLNRSITDSFPVAKLLSISIPDPGPQRAITARPTNSNPRSGTGTGTGICLQVDLV